MKIALICKSDTKGGAAVVTFRLMEALRRIGVDARMIVAEKTSGSPWVIQAISGHRSLIPFLSERLKIFVKNGFSRQTLFRIDTASDGLPLYRIPFVKEADAICLNWVNQGMLSLQGLIKLNKLGKPIIWTMHDMWNMTGICHHAGYCRHWLSPDGKCGYCPLLCKKGSLHDLSYKTWMRKKKVYDKTDIHFVAVSNWLAGCARRSSLMDNADISVIPNAFPITDCPETTSGDRHDGKIRIIFGAARIDDPVKRHDILVAATKAFNEKYPALTGKIELVTFGGVKDPDALSGISIPHTDLGVIAPSRICDIYETGDIVVSTSEWETLPGTLIEGQAWGCVPVAFDHGGQSDIIDHLQTGYLARWSDNNNPEIAMRNNAEAIADGIAWAAETCRNTGIKERMRESVCARFSEDAVAKRYLDLIHNL